LTTFRTPRFRVLGSRIAAAFFMSMMFASSAVAEVCDKMFDEGKGQYVTDTGLHWSTWLGSPRPFVFLLLAFIFVCAGYLGKHHWQLWLSLLSAQMALALFFLNGLSNYSLFASAVSEGCISFGLSLAEPAIYVLLAVVAFVISWKNRSSQGILAGSHDSRISWRKTLLLRSFKWAFWSIVAILLLLGNTIAWPLYKGYSLDRQFLSHIINRQIVERYTNNNAGQQSLDIRFEVTDLFRPSLNRFDFERELESIGYVCDRDTRAGDAKLSYCRATAGYNLVCRKEVSLTAQLDAQNTVRKIHASYMLTCL
jgi:hypothetical protein